MRMEGEDAARSTRSILSQVASLPIQLAAIAVTERAEPCAGCKETVS